MPKSKQTRQVFSWWLRLSLVAVIITLFPLLTLSVRADDTQKNAEAEKARRALADRINNTSAEVARLTNQQRYLANQVNDLQDKITALTKEQHAVETELTIIEKNIEQTKLDILLTEGRIQQSELRLEAGRERIKAAYAELVKTRELLASHVRLTNRLDIFDGQLGAILASDSFADFSARLRSSMYLSASDDRLIAQIGYLQDFLKEAQGRETTERVTLQHLKDEQLALKVQLVDQQQEREQVLMQVKERLLQSEDAKQAATQAYADAARRKANLENQGKALVRLQEDVIFAASVNIAAVQLQASKDERVKGTGMPRFIWPSEGSISSPFGWRSNVFGSGGKSYHNGIDLAAPMCAPVKAMADGVVVIVGKPFGDGAEVVMLAHTKDVATLYAHLTDRNPCPPPVREGQAVKRGDVIGFIGSTGQSTGPHLHFMVSVSGKFVDPAPFLP